jgi:hypothetical protein
MPVSDRNQSHHLELAEEPLRKALSAPEQLVNSIREKNLSFYTDPRGKGALRDLQQTFPHPWLYIAELLQNAIDEKATHIALTCEDDRLVFEHNGTGFDQEDVAALCARGVSTKGAGTIGFMGVGFKSVFRSFESVEVSSGPWKFKLTVAVHEGEFGDLQRDWLGAVLPLWDDAVEPPSNGMTCRFTLSGRLTGLSSTTSDLEHVFGEENNLLALLAWRGVKELIWNDARWLLNRKEGTFGVEIESPLVLEALDQSNKNLRRWIMFISNYEPSREAVGRFLEHRQLNPTEDEKEYVYAEASRHREVAVFCEIGEQNNPRPAARGTAFALLPTGITLPIGLHVQADWLLVVSRQEIMQIEGNQWHQEILKQIPRLLRNFLKWLVSDRVGDDWDRGYDALPSSYRQDADTDRWFGQPEFSDLLGKELRTLEFLPVRSSNDAEIFFISPLDAEILPTPLAKQFDNDSSRQTSLFGEHVASRTLLGKRALQCVSSLGLLHELDPSELAQRWSEGVVGTWLDGFEESGRQKLLASLLSCLSEMNEHESWRNSKLVCLPTESGSWEHRETLRRFPGDWDALAQETELRSALEPLLGSTDTMLQWELDRTWTQSRSGALRYLESVSIPKLEDVVNGWWESLPEQPSTDQVQLILKFTSWVRAKQPQRKRMIRKVLCGAESAGMKLVKAEDSLLAQPYAGTFRRTFFPSLPTICPDYAQFDPSGSVTDWRSFFESLTPAPKGPFALRLLVSTLTWRGLKEQFGDDYSPPSLRSSWYRTKWMGLDINNSEYKLLNPELPRIIKDLLTGEDLSFEAASDFCSWLSETPGGLREYPLQRLAFIGFGDSQVSERLLPHAASWVLELKHAKWVPSKRGANVYCPSDVLAVEDAARPDAPVANLTAELIETLTKAGLEFGSALPDAPAIDRLSVQGPQVDATQLLELTEKAIAESVGDENKRFLLLKVLKENKLVPRPAGSISLDGQPRVSYSRLVRTSARSNLSDWLVVCERFSVDSSERKLLDLIHSFVRIPETTTAEQVMDFLTWVWRTEPEVDRLRSVLPRAYQYLRDDLRLDQDLTLKWTTLQTKAKVFITPQRRWVSLKGNERVFLDDLAEALPANITAGLELATPGHLGENLSERLTTAQMLGLSLLSSRFSVVIQPEGKKTLPENWQEAFAFIQKRLRDKIAQSDETDGGDKADDRVTDDHPALSLALWGCIKTQVLDHSSVISVSESHAAIVGDTIAVSGSPAEFASDLCTVLCNRWRLRLRRDLADILPNLTVQLMSLGNPDLLSKWAGTLQSESDFLPQTGNMQSVGSNIPDETQSLVESPASDNSNEADVESGSSIEGGVESDSPTVSGSEEGSNLSGSESPPAGGSHTAHDREARLASLIKRRAELDRQINEIAAVGVVPDEIDDALAKAKGEFHSDDPYRNAAIEYERKRNRWAIPKSANEEGHDIDSYTHEEGHPDRHLIRRIEVKGKGVNWNADEIVEMSDSQFKHALIKKTEDEIELHPDFDYWLYVVENDGSGLTVLPIKNPARRAARYEFRGATWRDFTDLENES